MVLMDWVGGSRYDPPGVSVSPRPGYRDGLGICLLKPQNFAGTTGVGVSHIHWTCSVCGRVAAVLLPDSNANIEESRVERRRES